MESLGFSICSITSSEYNNSFTFSFPIWMPSLSPCLITVAVTSNTMLNKNGESGLPCLIPNLKENACGFCPFNMRWSVGFSYMAFIMFRYVPCIPTLLG